MPGDRGHCLGAAAGAVTLVSGGLVILALLLLYGREEKEE
jgi:hypothetical protein